MAKSSSGELIETAAKVTDIDEIKKARTALANLVLKIVDDINNRRVQNPEQSYNALANIFNAIK